MKILHINCNYMDSWLHQTMIEELEKKNIKNDVFVPLYNKNGHIVNPKEYVKLSVCFKKYDRLLYHYKQSKIYKSLNKLFNVTEYDCLHAYTLFTDGNIARRLSKEFNIPYVVAVRNTDVNTFFKYMPHLRKIGVKIMKDAKAIFFLSEVYRNMVINKYVKQKDRKILLDKCYIIPNGIDDFWHKNIDNNKENLDKKIKRIKSKNLELIYVGNIDKNKNLITTCKSIEKLEKDGWKIKYTVAGKIKDKAVYEKVKNKINYKGVATKEQLLEYYRKSDIFVMPSFKETFGLVYAEAMSQGLPVIYTKGQGFDCQFTEGKVGYHVNCKDYENIVKKIKKITENYEVIVKNCLKNVERFKWKDISEFYYKLYLKILNN